ncbi:5-formyltetrahydrofolate cyclo-ligase [Bacillus sp. AK128]
MMKTKKELRLEIKSKLQSLSTYEFEQANKRIVEQFFNTESWKKSDSLGLTISRGREIETKTIIERAWAMGKKVAVPKCFPEEKRMSFYFITSNQQLEEVFFGLKEPIPSMTEPASEIDLDLLIVPGICYTKKGYRIGYGGGYYDRYLENYHNSTLSLLMECQLVPKIPIEPHDFSIQQMITEERIITCDE